MAIKDDSYENIHKIKITLWKLKELIISVLTYNFLSNIIKNIYLKINSILNCINIELNLINFIYSYVMNCDLTHNDLTKIKLMIDELDTHETIYNNKLHDIINSIDIDIISKEYTSNYFNSIFESFIILISSTKKYIIQSLSDMTNKLNLTYIKLNI